MGFPVLVKAALGGGGKGMKLAMQEDELEVHMRLWTHCLSTVTNNSCLVSCAARG